METLGVWLRQTREAQGSSLEDVEAETRIRPRFLEALEQGNYGVFPGGAVQIRGFLRIYARHLGLSPDHVLARYDQQVRGGPTTTPAGSTETQSTTPVRPTTGPAASPSRGTPSAFFQPQGINLSTLVIIGLATVVLVTAIVVGGYFVIRSTGRETSTATATATAATADAGAAPTDVAMLTPSTVTPTFPIDPEGGVTLALEATEHVWARISADGLVVFSGMMTPDQIETWEGRDSLSVDTGNGAGLLVTVNGQQQGAMCGRGQVCSRTWGPSGEIARP
jgi:cytoskeletal protein RodZ